MNFLSITCLFITFVKFSIAIIWEPDNDQLGLIFQPIKKVHLLDTFDQLTFEFDVRSLSFFSNKTYILSKCPNNTLDVELFHARYQRLDVNWTRFSNVKLKNGHLLIHKPTILKEIESLQSLFPNNCSLLRQINTLILEANVKLDKLIKLDLDALDSFVSLHEIYHSAKYRIEHLAHRYAVPFNHDLFTSEFWKHVQTNFLFKDNSFFIEIEIPFYTQRELQLFLIRPKPMVWANQAYLYKHSNQYAIIDTTIPILYSQTEYETFCKSFLDKIFCKWDTKLQNTCYDVVFGINGKKYNSECFEPIKSRNSATQIGQEVYFTVFTPLQVWIERFEFKYSINLPHSMKAISPIESNLTTSFFHFNTKKQDIYATRFETEPVFKDFFTQMNYKDQLKFIAFLTLSLTLITIMLLTKELGQQFFLYICLKNELIKQTVQREQNRLNLI